MKKANANKLQVKKLIAKLDEGKPHKKSLSIIYRKNWRN